MIRAIVVMGVSGCGKSTLARALAERLGYRFVEGDELHPAANVAKMAAGIPLDDADRAPFLDAVGRALAEPGGVVASCSALKRAYRDRLRALAGDVLFVLPDLAIGQVRERLARRAGHFMPTSLLDSQFAALEPPGPDERAIHVDGALPVEQQVAKALTQIASGSPG